MGPRVLSLMLAVLLVGTAALGQAPEPPPPAKLPGESATTARRLGEAAKLAEQGKWADAVEEYQRIQEEVGDDLVALDPLKPQLCVQARRLCHQGIAALPADALKLYRKRADEQAKKWLDDGSADRDPALLRRLVDQAYCSRHTDRALDLLGDLALERGDFEEAEQWWRHLAVPASDAKDAKAGTRLLLYPDCRIEPALVRAKQILAQVLRGARADAAAELKAFRAIHASATGHLAGRQGNLGDILQKLLAQEGLAAGAAEDAWRTFAGAPARTYILPRVPRGRWLAEPWRVRLDGGADVGPAPAQTAAQAARACVYFPAVVDNFAILADARAVSVYDLGSGRRLGKCDLLDDLKHAVDADGKQPAKHDGRHSVTVHGDRIYARLGATALARGKNDARPGQHDSFLVCLALPPRADGSLTPLWQAKARVLDSDYTFFEGTPIVRGTAAFVARTRLTEDGRATTAVACYHAETGMLRWERDICEARETLDAEPRHRHQLLTLAGPLAVFCSHSGAVVAVDATSGKRVWAARYPRRGPRTAEGDAAPRDLAPCVYAHGRLFVAPADADHILCLDAVSGQRLWESKTLEVVQLLGVAKGKLIVTTGSRPRGIRALDAATGADLRDWIQPDDGVSELPTVGRGLLAGDWVFWPTANGLRVLNQEDGSVNPLVPLRNKIKGNLAAGSGCLVVATERELLGYVPEGWQPIRNAALDGPTPARAVASVSRGRNEHSADVTLQSAVQQSPPSPRTRGEGPGVRGEPSQHWLLRPSPPTPLPEYRERGDSLFVDAGNEARQPLERRWEVPLTDKPNGMLPLACYVPETKALLLLHDGVLRLRDAATGKDRWTRPCTHPVAWLHAQAGLALAAGPTGIAAVHLSDGKEAWQLKAEEPAEPWAHFRIAGGRLYYLQDERRLFAVDLATGKPLWSVWAPGARVLPEPPAGRFDSKYHAGLDAVVVRCANGQRWVLDAATGKRLHATDNDTTPWPLPPLPLGKHDLCLVREGRLIERFAPLEGRGIWRHSIERPASLTGEPPQVLASGAVVAVLVARNHGYELELLDAAKGSVRWTKFLGLRQESINLRHAALDDRALYLAADNLLQAFAITDGKLLWEASLGTRPARWRVLPSPHGLLVASLEARAEVAWTAHLRRALAANPAGIVPSSALLPLAAGLPGVLTVLRSERTPSSISVALLDPRDGQLVQRLNFSSTGSSARVAVQDRWVVIVGKETAWGIQ